MGLPKGLINWLNRIPSFLFLIPLLLFGDTNIDEHTKKWINPDKKYEISGIFHDSQGYHFLKYNIVHFEKK